MRIAIIGGEVVNPVENTIKPLNIYIKGKKIVAVDSQPPPNFQAEQTIDATNRYIFPGLIDLQVRCREPGFEHISTIQSETYAALSSGITTSICPPDTNPIIDNKAAAELIIKRAQEANVGRVLPVGAMTKKLRGKKLSEMAALKEAGCVAVSNADVPIKNLGVLLKAFLYAKTIDLPVILRPFEASLQHRGGVNDSAVSALTGLPAIPRESELIALQKYLYLIKKSKVRAHISLLSCAESVELIRHAKEQGVEVTADVAIHQLFFTDEKTKDFNSLFHLNPPLREERDITALRKGLKDGVIDAICSDHRPWNDENKNLPFGESEIGLSGVDTLLYLSLLLQQEEGWELSEIISLLSDKAARCLGLEAGTLNAGDRADLSIFDANKKREIQKQDIRSKGKNNAFIGYSVSGEITHTFKSGELVYLTT
jgi:dihydroorotase